MENCFDEVMHNDIIPVVVRYLTGAVQEWWIVFIEFDDGEQIQTWINLRSSLIGPVDAFKKRKIAREKLSYYRDVKDVPTFNYKSQNIVLYIPANSTKEYSWIAEYDDTETKFRKNCAQKTTMSLPKQWKTQKAPKQHCVKWKHA